MNLWRDSLKRDQEEGQVLISLLGAEGDRPCSMITVTLRDSCPSDSDPTLLHEELDLKSLGANVDVLTVPVPPHFQNERRHTATTTGAWRRCVFCFVLFDRLNIVQSLSGEKGLGLDWADSIIKSQKFHICSFSILNLLQRDCDIYSQGTFRTRGMLAGKIYHSRLLCSRKLVKSLGPMYMIGWELY